VDPRISGTASGVGPHKSMTPRLPADEMKSEAAPKPVLAQSIQDTDQIVQQLEKAIRAVQGPQKTFEISIHKETQAIMVKVRDRDTGELIREIPKEKLLDVAANLMELNGLIFDEKA
jgi:flagellar protein FlaG